MMSVLMIIFFYTIQIHMIKACTNLLVSKDISIDNSNIISYNADAANFYTTIYHYPASINSNDTTRKIWSWDYGTYLGEIPEALETYNVVGNVNEYGLIITESTFGGLLELENTRNDGIIDYGSLIWITLQRTKSAREAIMMMDYLVNTYGYASTGESFSIADQNELWIMELIGKGRYELGAVWVARLVPSGYVTGHANQARITTFSLDDPINCLYSSDIISFAKKIDLYHGNNEDFSFSDIYDPITFDGARFCEARVWSFFSAIMGEAWSNQYLDYAQGYNLTNRMPLFVQPSMKISIQDIMQSMRNHYEGTALDNTGRLFSDVGAGAFYNPNRNSPITWKSSTSSNPKNQYFNERTIAQAPTGWSIVCQSRPNVPRQISALMWYGIDDSSTSVHFPVYGGITRIPVGWAGKGPQDGVTPPMMTFSLDSAFYVFNLVANYAYSRWNDIYPDIYQEIITKEIQYFDMVEVIDQNAMELFYSNQIDKGLKLITNFTVDIGNKLLKDWFLFFGQLFVKYRDGYITTSSPLIPVCGCSTNSLPYTNEWYNRIIDDTGDRYLVPETDSSTTIVSESKKLHPTIPKQKLRAFM